LSYNKNEFKLIQLFKIKITKKFKISIYHEGSSKFKDEERIQHIHISLACIIGATNKRSSEI